MSEAVIPVWMVPTPATSELEPEIVAEEVLPPVQPFVERKVEEGQEFSFSSSESESELDEDSDSDSDIERPSAEQVAKIQLESDKQRQQEEMDDLAYISSNIPEPTPHLSLPRIAKPSSNLSSDSSSSSSDDSSDSETDSGPDTAGSAPKPPKSMRNHLKQLIGTSTLADDLSSDDENQHTPSTLPAIKSEHEQKEEYIQPPVQRVEDGATLLPLGRIHSRVGDTLVIRSERTGAEKVFDSGSIVCKADRSVLGVINETFGSVSEPFYSILLPPQTELQVEAGLEVFSTEGKLAKFVFTQALKKNKGTDASNRYDEELPDEEQEWSDDEAEAEYKKSRKLANRALGVDEDTDMPSSRPEGADSSATFSRGRGRGNSMRGRGGARGQRGRGRGGNFSEGSSHQTSSYVPNNRAQAPIGRHDYSSAPAPASRHGSNQNTSSDHFIQPAHHTQSSHPLPSSLPAKPKPYVPAPMAVSNTIQETSYTPQPYQPAPITSFNQSIYPQYQQQIPEHYTHVGQYAQQHSHLPFPMASSPSFQSHPPFTPHSQYGHAAPTAQQHHGYTATPQQYTQPVNTNQFQTSAAIAQMQMQAAMMAAYTQQMNRRNQE